ncbi:MAG: hypothetical protein ACT4N8_02790 [Sphingosinicella sp.]|uniref:hypothetical protein n=1 Tax=Sphingosinicella sp. TaxID=1917971 RepID=UPI004037A431
MSLSEIEDSKRAAMRARRRFEATLAAAQQRLHPQNLAGEAWDGVKGKSADLAEGALGAVKKRPAAVSLALGALGLFLARAPLKRAVSRLIAGDEDSGADAGIDPSDAELRETA